jgi:hypothetical protein
MSTFINHWTSIKSQRKFYIDKFIERKRKNKKKRNGEHLNFRIKWAPISHDAFLKHRNYDSMYSYDL